MPVIVLVADGARYDAFSGDLSDLPALRRLRDEGGLHAVTTVFPSVTGPAYLPFLVGRFPGQVGIPGLRWYDRSRATCGWPDYARSYVGHQFRRFDTDLAPDAPTIFELAPRSIGALSVLTRGLPSSARIGTLTVRSAARAAFTHFRGRVGHWLDVDREVADTIPRRIREERPDYVFAAFTGVDKASHARGHDSSLVHEALRIVDGATARLRDDAERGGWWDDTHLWIVSDHGHASVHSHEDLAGVIAATGRRTVAHPWSAGIAPDVAVMVSGNAMAHVYTDVGHITRRWWPEIGESTNALAAALLSRESVDVMLLPHGAHRCEIRSATRGSAFVSLTSNVLRYERISGGDPLCYGADLAGSADALHDATAGSTYPDGPAQVLALAGSERAGDIILSATPGWDFRARYEPIPHLSAHGALHHEHMRVPLLVNRPPKQRPRRTTDVFASSLAALGIAPPPVMNGATWL